MAERTDPIARLLRRTRAEGDCLIFEGSTLPLGYARVNVGGVVIYGHRLMWEREHGPIPAGMVLHHHCERKACVNPAHLELLTRSDHNMEHASATCPACGSIDWYTRRGRPNRQCRVCNRARQRRKRGVMPEHYRAAP